MNREYKEVIELLFAHSDEKYNFYLIREIAGILGITEDKLLSEVDITRTEI